MKSFQTDDLADELRTDDIGEITVIQILKVADLLLRIGDAHVFTGDLSQAQFNILMILKRYGKDGMSQKDILSRRVSTKGNLSIHITNLLKKSYITRRISKTDNRLHEIRLAAKGRRLLEKLEPKYFKKIRELTDELSEGAAAKTLLLLTHLQAKCGELLCRDQVEEA